MELTVKEFASLERVDERTVRRWIAKGAVAVRRTPGGGIRIKDQASNCRVVVLGLTNRDNEGHPAA